MDIRTEKNVYIQTVLVCAMVLATIGNAEMINQEEVDIRYFLCYIEH